VVRDDLAPGGPGTVCARIDVSGHLLPSLLSDCTLGTAAVDASTVCCTRQYIGVHFVLADTCTGSSSVQVAQHVPKQHGNLACEAGGCGELWHDTSQLS